MTPLLILAGAGLLLLSANEVFVTILHSRGRAGFISEMLNRSVWSAARSLTRHLSRERRHRCLNKVGPLLLPILIGVLVVLLIVGYALIYVPHLPEGFSIDHGKEAPRLQQALYFSGAALLTLGSDIYPRTAAMQLASIMEAATGLAVISLTVTYLLTVYSALERKRAIALAFYHRAEEGADVAGYLARHFVEGEFHGLAESLNTGARELHSLLEAHMEHPVIHYFHTIEVHKCLPRILFLALETCTVLRTCLDAGTHSRMVNHPAVHILETSARHVLDGLVAALDLKHKVQDHLDAPQEEKDRQQRRFAHTMARLEQAGIAVRSDRAAAEREYRQDRNRWESQVQHFGACLAYDWEEIAGDRDLEAARENADGIAG